MISRLWLKNKKLDKFDCLDNNGMKPSRSNPLEELTLLQSFSMESTQRHSLDFLLKVLLLEWLAGQKILSNKTENFKKFATIRIKLRKQKLFVLLDIFINVLFLSNHWILIFDESQILLGIKNTSELHTFIDSFHLNDTKFLFDTKLNTGNFIQIAAKNFPNQGFYKLINKGE